MTNKTRFKLFQCDHDSSLIDTFAIPLTSPCKPKYITSPNKTLMCVCADLASLTYI